MQEIWRWAKVTRAWLLPSSIYIKYKQKSQKAFILLEYRSFTRPDTIECFVYMLLLRQQWCFLSYEKADRVFGNLAYSIYELNWKRSRYHKNWENSQKARQIGFTNAHFYLAFGYLSRLKYQETVSVVSLRIRELIAITKNLSITGVLPSNFIICNTAISTKVLHHVNTYSSMRAWNLKWKIWIPSKKTTSSGDLQQKSVIQDIFFHCGRRLVDQYLYKICGHLQVQCLSQCSLNRLGLYIAGCVEEIWTRWQGSYFNNQRLFF